MNTNSGILAIIIVLFEKNKPVKKIRVRKTNVFSSPGVNNKTVKSKRSPSSVWFLFTKEIQPSIS